MGVFNLVLFSLFLIGAFAGYAPEHQDSDILDKHYSIGKKWAFLVCGSRGWTNYRHQANILHAYHVMVGNGIPKENIIVMMWDDVATHKKNPTPGKIINKPRGPDVYAGVKIDYKGVDVNSKNFLNILTGNKTAVKNIGSGRVIESGPLDTIFINFVDHGSTGLWGFPKDYLYADQLNKALKQMRYNRAYRKILLYVDACKGGSMFDGLLAEDSRVLAITSSGPREAAHSCYCRPVCGAYLTCLGDLFSVTWMEELDENGFSEFAKRRTVFSNFNDVRTNVTESNVMVYGDYKVGQERFSTFVGFKQQNDNSVIRKATQKTTLSSRDVTENFAQHELADTQLTSLEKQKLKNSIHLNDKMRLVIDKVLKGIYSMVVKVKPHVKKEVGEFDKPNHKQLTMDMFPCYRSIINKISERCFSLPQNPYSLDRLTVFANLCVVDKNIHQIVDKFVSKLCTNIPKNIMDVY